MTLTITDLFCGAGGSSLGAEAAGGTLVMAANHWQTAIDVHQANFPHADHDCADISQADPRRYPRTDMLLASPECTNHSQARATSRKLQHPELWDAADPMAERSRATMWDVVRFAEQMRYDVMLVENVVEATKWLLWEPWCQALAALGYEFKVLSHNSMDHGVPQSRDRIYVACWRKGLRPDLEMELDAYCPSCDAIRTVRQGWKPGRSVGRYRQQWLWHCVVCHGPCEPTRVPAATIIDWSLDCPRIGDRKRPLAAKTRDRIYAGLEKYGWLEAITTRGAGPTFETTPGNRARTLDEPLPVQFATSTSAIATPPGFLVQTAHGTRDYPLSRPYPTVCASDDRLTLIVPMRNHGEAQGLSEPVPTVTAGGNHHGLVVRSYGFVGSGPTGRFTTSTDDPLPTCVTSQSPALLMRNNGGGSEMTTPVSEPARTMTTKGHQSLIDPAHVVDDCGFRMLEPHEIAAAMAFPEGYIPVELPKRERVKLAGNAVTPPVAAWLVGRLAQALEAR